MTQKISIAEQRAMGGLPISGRRSLREIGEAMLRRQTGESVKPAARSKYNNRKTVVDGITFDSEWEAERYQELRLLERAGHIVNLRLQVPYVLAINDVKICRYVADFVYLELGVETVEDAKGMLTDVYKLKRRLMKAIYGIEIRETRKQS